MVIGLGTRRFSTYLPTFVAEYAGDALWAWMVFLGLGVVAPRTRISRRAVVALVVSFALEISQLYHAPWIDALRQTTLGGLVLGFGFLWSDLVCYTVGIAVGAVLEYAMRRHVGTGRQSGGSKGVAPTDRR